MSDYAYDPELRFREVQSFRGGRIWIALVIQFVLLTALFGWALYHQMLLGQPWGNRPTSDDALIATFSFVLLLNAGLFALFYFARLITEVTTHELRIRYIPFHLKPRTFPLSDIESAVARRYRPIAEYGGWGIRGSFGRGMAYNVKGNLGVQLVMKNGRRLLIGSQRPAELAVAIQKWSGSAVMSSDARHPLGHEQRFQRYGRQRVGTRRARLAPSSAATGEANFGEPDALCASLPSDRDVISSPATRSTG